MNERRTTDELAAVGPRSADKLPDTRPQTSRPFGSLARLSRQQPRQPATQQRGDRHDLCRLGGCSMTRTASISQQVLATDLQATPQHITSAGSSDPPNLPSDQRIRSLPESVRQSLSTVVSAFSVSKQSISEVAQ